MNLKNYFFNQFSNYLKQSSRFIMIIIIMDLLPLIALFFWGWSAIEALYLYTLETIILLLITLRKIWRSKYILALFASQTEKVIGNRTKIINSFFKKPLFSWVLKGARGILYLVFLIIWFPLILLQLMLISAVSGNGFSLFGFLEHDSGKLDLGFVSLNLMIVFLVLLFLEHTYAYRKKFIKEKEYENTRFINEGLSFSIRVFVQQFITIGLFALISLMHIDTISMVIIILFKTLIDVFSYLFNRIWGGLKNKIEGQG